MSLRRRLQRLERHPVAAGCPACRVRRRIVTRTATPDSDGALVWDRDEPQPCACCGEIPEYLINVILPLVDERSNASEYGASA